MTDLIFQPLVHTSKVAAFLLCLLATSSCAEGEQRETSPRISALREAVRRSNPNAVEDFLREVKARGGTPLIEMVPGDDQNVQATFLWQGDDTTRSVLIDWYPFSVSRPAEMTMVRLESTSLWYRTLRIPREARFYYQLSVNDPQATSSNSSAQSHPGPDPLNPRQNVAEMPGAPAQPYLAHREGVPRLKMVKEQVRSRILNERRSVLVYTPPGWSASQRLPSLVLFDGEEEEGVSFASSTVENLIHERKIPPIVVARIPNPNGQSRMRDLGCSPEFTDFLAKELMPLLQTKYGVSTSATEAGVGGVSRGGLAAVCAGLQAPDRFGLILSQSGSLWWVPDAEARKPYHEPGWVIRQFLERPRLPLRFYLDVGKFEWDATGEGFGTLEPARRLRDVLRAKGYDVAYQESYSGHEGSSWRGGFADALIALFGQLNRP